MTTSEGGSGEESRYLLAPQLWFGLLCEAVQRDEHGRFSFERVFNRIAYQNPPEISGVPPHGFLNGFLVVGYQRGVGHFELHVTLRDADGALLWTNPESIAFELGPDATGHVAAIEARQWLTQPGRYYFELRLEPGQTDEVSFEVGVQPRQLQEEPTEP